MQQLIIRQELPSLLLQTAAARMAFEERRRFTIERPAYQVKAVSRGFYHVIETSTDKVLGFRRSHGEAIAYAKQLTIRALDDIGAEG